MNDIVFCSECEYCGKTNLPKTHFCSEYQCVISIAGCERGKRKAKTHSDNIRTMPDEKLAIVFSDHASCELCPAIQEKCGYGNGCQEAWLKWLRQEVKE